MMLSGAGSEIGLNGDETIVFGDAFSPTRRSELGVVGTDTDGEIGDEIVICLTTTMRNDD